jgi:hypothetical protein
VALLPSVDLVVGQAVGDALQNGKKVTISGSITREGAPTYKDNIDVRMELDKEKKEVVTVGRYGPHACWADPGTHVLERGTVNLDDMSYNISGYVGIGTDGNEPSNESLKISAGLGEISMKGKLDDYAIEQKVNIDPLAGSVNHEGIIAGHEFHRSIKPLSRTESAIEGNYGSLPEKGKIAVEPDGSLSISRDIGPYRIREKVTFEG